MSADTDSLIRGVMEMADRLAPDGVVTLAVGYDEDHKSRMPWVVRVMEGGPGYRGKTLASACKNWQRAYRKAARG